jgi:hypothetical protein
MAKLNPYLSNGFPKLCWGCGKPFPIRHGNIEALVGEGGRLYCYAGKPECAELALASVTGRDAAWALAPARPAITM